MRIVSALTLLMRRISVIQSTVLRAGRRRRSARDAEALAGLVELEMVVHRLAVAGAVQVADAVFLAGVERDAVLLAPRFVLIVMTPLAAVVP